MAEKLCDVKLTGKTPSIVPDANNLLGSITTGGGSYTATEDCVMKVVNMGAGSSTEAMVYLDNKTFLSTYNSPYGCYMSWDYYGIFIPEGITVTTKSGSGLSYDIKFYKCAN